MLLDTRFYRDIINKGNKVGLPAVGTLCRLQPASLRAAHTEACGRHASQHQTQGDSFERSGAHSQPAPSMQAGPCRLQTPQPEAAACRGRGTSLQAAR